MVMPRLMDNAAKRERMAILEAAIASTLSHPNLIQTFTYGLRPIRVDDEFPSNRELGPNFGPFCSFEVQIIMEFCDLGSLRNQLDLGVFSQLSEDGGSRTNVMAVLEVRIEGCFSCKDPSDPCGHSHAHAFVSPVIYIVSWVAGY